VEEKTGKCENGQCVPIGLDTIEFPARGTFSVVTNSKSPYCGGSSQVAFQKEFNVQ
jgi:hypothetical protein